LDRNSERIPRSQLVGAQRKSRLSGAAGSFNCSQVFQINHENTKERKHERKFSFSRFCAFVTGTLPASPARKGGVEGSYIKTAEILTGKPRP